MNRLTQITALAVAILANPVSAEAVAEQMPGWLAGTWLAEQPDGSWSEEWWSAERAGIMLGGGRSGKGDTLGWWELTRIERTGDTITFCALPKGQKGACFPATSSSANAIVFENPDHDFPTRIAYRREGDRLFAEISGPGGANPQRWQFRRSDQASAPAFSARMVSPFAPTSAKPPLTGIRSGAAPGVR